MKLLAITFGVIFAGIGIVGIAAPSLIEQFGRSMLTPTSIYVIGALRIFVGIVLYVVAPVSRVPVTLRVIGVLVIVAGLFTPAFGVQRSMAILDWVSGQGPWFMRALLCIPVAFGAFIAYALSSPRTPR